MHGLLAWGMMVQVRISGVQCALAEGELQLAQL